MPSGYERSPDYGGKGPPPWFDVLLFIAIFAPFLFLLAHLAYTALAWIGLVLR